MPHGGAEYTNAHTSDPSDSDPGGTALMTGGDPRATGVYYDVEYNHKPVRGGHDCVPRAPTGGDVIYDSPDDIDAYQTRSPARASPVFDETVDLAA